MHLTLYVDETNSQIQLSSLIHSRTPTRKVRQMEIEDKSTVSMIHRAKRRPPTRPIVMEMTTKYIGVEISLGLTFTLHIDSAINKVKFVMSSMLLTPAI